jgi:hypothetical protein
VDKDSENATVPRSVPRRCVCANHPIYFVTLNVTTVNLAVTSEFNFDSFTGEKCRISSHNTMLCSALLFSFPIPFT